MFPCCHSQAERISDRWGKAGSGGASERVLALQIQDQREDCRDGVAARTAGDGLARGLLHRNVRRLRRGDQVEHEERGWDALVNRHHQFAREEVLRQGQLEVAPAFHGAECEADRLRVADALRRAARPTHGTGAGGALR